MGRQEGQVPWQPATVMAAGYKLDSSVGGGAEPRSAPGTPKLEPWEAGPANSSLPPPLST